MENNRLEVYQNGCKRQRLHIMKDTIYEITGLPKLEETWAKMEKEMTDGVQPYVKDSKNNKYPFPLESLNELNLKNGQRVSQEILSNLSSFTDAAILAKIAISEMIDNRLQ